MSEWQAEEWLSDSEINEVEYSRYWNDEEEEKSKAWYVVDGKFAKMERYLQETGLLDDLQRCVAILRTDFKRHVAGVGMDLAAGNLWAAPHLLNLGTVDKLYCVEYSRHRLLRLGPTVLDHYNVPRERAVLALGSFYDLHVPDHSVDFIFMAQALHHADNPARLLREICRVLKPRGVVIIIGEHIVSYARAYVRHVVKFIVSALAPAGLQRRLWGKTFDVKTLTARPSELLSPDPILGDHYYTDQAYRLMFSQCGFEVRHFKNHNSGFQSFVLVRSEAGS